MSELWGHRRSLVSEESWLDEENLEDDIDDSDDTIDNTNLSYMNQILYIRLNDKRNQFEENRYRLDENIRFIKKTYPSVFNGCEEGRELQFLLDNIFTEGFSKTFFITNLTFKTNDRVRDRLSIRPLKEGIYLTESLPENMTITFKGHLSSEFFVIDEIRLATDSEPRDYEVEIYARPFHTNIPQEKKDFFLRDFLRESESFTSYTEEKLEEWESFIKWRTEITKKRILGCKYFDVRYDSSNKTINFSLVFNDKDEFKSFKKYLRRDIKVFENSYSTDSLHFKFAYDNKRRQIKPGIDLGRFNKVEEEYYLKDRLKEEPDEEAKYLDVDDKGYDDLEVTEEDSYDVSDSYDEEASDEDIELDFDDNEVIPLTIIMNQFENPYIVKVSYELDHDHLDAIEESYLSEESELDYVNKNVLSEINKQGFLALSGVGEFALLKRFERAISQLKKDESSSPNLAFWLFNISQARVPNTKGWIKITKWLNKGIQSNQDQMIAVEKMLNVEDVTLIQGPPGTGKTTVIAEAIYQFVSRGQRVLVASQSNDAVDNALERLAETPSIRAIRLGQKNRRKKLKDESLITKFSEEKSMETFYKSISTVLEKEYISKWDEIEKKSIEYKTHIRDCNEYIGSIDTLSLEKSQVNEAIKNGEELINNLNKKLDEIKEEQNRLNLIIYQVNSFKSYLNDPKGNFVIPHKELEFIFYNILQMLKKINKMGINLSNGIEVDLNYLASINGNDLMQLIVDNIRVFKELLDKTNKMQDMNAVNTDIQIIDAKIKNIQDDMLNIDDDMKLMKLFKEMKELKKQKDSISKESKSASLTNKELSIINDLGISKITVNGNIDPGRLKELLKDNKHYVLALKERLKETADTIIQNINLTKTNDNEFDMISMNINRCTGEINFLKEKITEIDKNINYFNKKIEYLFELYNVDDKNELLKAIERLQEENANEVKKSKEFRNQFENLIINFKSRLDDTENHKYDREYYEDIYINACNVVGISCTDNMRVLTDKGYNDFDVVIIDEVSKATPPELLIPLMKARKAILVGDHRQLPPLFKEHEKSYKEIIYSSADDEDENEDENLKELLTEENFKRFRRMVTASLFKEYFEKADSLIKHSLLTQYRMHSDIMNVINRFYDGRLNNGLDKDTENKIKNHDLTIKAIDGTRFIVPDKHAYWIDSSTLPNQEEFYETRPQGSTSAENILECFLIVELLKKMAQEYREKGYNKNNQKTVGVISFYQLQVNRLRNMIKKEKKKFDFSSLNIDINTVDRFQGKEKQIIITSLVRNLKTTRRSEGSHIAAFERINVAFSRAQEMLVIVGARNMYAGQPVKLPNMDSNGEKTVYVYRNIIEELNRNACYFGSGKLLNEGHIEQIKDIIKKEYN